VVSITEEIRTSIHKQMYSILEKISQKNIPGDVEGLFSKFIISKKIPSKIEWNVACDKTWMEKHSSELKQGNYICLASVGFSLNDNNLPLIESEFSWGFSQLIKRDPFPGDRISFTFHR
jgi:hypothetical protein